MTADADADAEFRSRARWLLSRGVAKATPDVLAAHAADPERVATAPLRTLFALAAANMLTTDAEFALMLATDRALDRIDWEHALLQAFPPPPVFDAAADGAYAVKVVLHPTHGVGLVEVDYADEPGGGRRARVCFRDGERVLSGRAARWEHPRRTFAFAASLQLQRLPDADEDTFWSHVDALDWGGGRPLDDLAAELAARVPLPECIALHGRLHHLASALRARIEAWEAAGNGPLPCGDDSLGDLTNHVVGLGRATYTSTLADPALALRRAETHAYRESFSYVFLGAQQRYTTAEIAAALRTHAADAVVEDPTLGLGVVYDDAIVFPERVVPRTSRP